MSVIQAACVWLIVSFTLLIHGQELNPSVIPLHYDVVLLPILNRNPRLCGHVYIDVEARNTTNVIRFHGAELEILDTTIELLSAPSMEIRSSSVYQERLDRVEELCFDRLTTPSVQQRQLGWMDNSVRLLREDQSSLQWTAILTKSLIQGRRYRLGFLYTAKIYEQIPKGFFRVKYTHQDSCCESWVGATQMESTNARRVLPCFDEPKFKASFTVTLGHETELKAVSNMPERFTRSMTDTEDWSWTFFDKSPPMPTYLLAAVVTDYQSRQVLYYVWDKPVLIRFWVRKEVLPLLNRTIAMTPKLLKFFETYLQEPYTLPKLDFMTVPSSLPFAAMENWGLVLYSESHLLFDDSKDSAKSGFEDNQVVAHELAHQFFGNLLTSESWSEIWISEGMCNLFEFESVSQVVPEEDMYNNKALVDSVQNVMRMEELVNTRALGQQLGDMVDYDSIFDPIAYNKGSAVLRMLRNFIGRNMFRNGLITYVDRYRFQSVRSSYLWDVFNEEFHRAQERLGRQMNIHTIMDSWTRQNLYPVVRCEWVLEAPIRRIRLSQSPYPHKNGNSSALWWIPLAMTDWSRADFSPSGTLPRVWLTPERPSLEVSIPLPRNGHEGAFSPGWIVLNGQMSGYFRVQYDELNYYLLSEQLLRNHSVIPDVTRSQLINDAFTLAEAGLLNYEVGPLRLIKYLKVVDDEFVRPTVIVHLARMKELSGTDSQIDIIKEYIKQLTRSMAEDTSDSFARNHQPARISKEGCNTEEGQCIESARRLYKTLMAGEPFSSDEKQIMLDEMEVIWCTAIRHGDQLEWDFAWKKSLSPKWIRQRSKILSALSCSSHPKRLKRLLTRVFHPSVEQSASETMAMLRGMAENSVGRSLAQRFLMANWKALNQLFGRASDAVELLMTASKYAKTDDDYQEMADFLSQQKDSAVSKTESTALLDNIQRNIHWVKNHAERVSSVVANIIGRSETN